MNTLQEANVPDFTAEDYAEMERDLKSEFKEKLSAFIEARPKLANPFGDYKRERQELARLVAVLYPRGLREALFAWATTTDESDAA